MTYRITGLDPAPYRHLFGRSDDDLARAGASRMQVTDRPGFPCRIGLDDVESGGTVLLLNHQSVPSGPYRASHAIFVEEGRTEPAVYEDEVPPALDRRTLSLRAFDAAHMMVDAVLAGPGEADAVIRALLDNDDVRIVHAHNAVSGCFAAVVERSE
jgi:hypothetical protein